MCTMAALVAVLLLVADGGGQDVAKKEMTRLEGEWSMVSATADGQSLPEQSVKGGKRVAKDGVTTITLGGRAFFKATFTIDAVTPILNAPSFAFRGPTPKAPHRTHRRRFATRLHRGHQCRAARARRTGTALLPPAANEIATMRIVPVFSALFEACRVGQTVEPVRRAISV
jgi:hypothetical protein